MLSIAVPPPSEFILYSTIEKIATECNKMYRTAFNDQNGYPMDMERFIDETFQIGICWACLDEPENTVLFAELSNDGECITINEKYKPLFDLRPEILRSTFGHELAHYVLKHYTLLQPNDSTLPLFPDYEITQVKPRSLHRRGWHQYDLTETDVKRLLECVDDSNIARKLLIKNEDELEPKWMFGQAEHFSMCLLTPKDKLYEIIGDNTSFNGWTRIYELARHFGVSPSMMKVRLRKLGFIEIKDDGKPGDGVKSKQRSLF